MKKTALAVIALIALAACSTKPSSEQAAKSAPDSYKVKFDTSKGPFVIEVTRALAPNGADRFYDLVQQKFFDEARFFRVLKGFVAQFGIHKDPEVSARWRNSVIPDDPVRTSNDRGSIVFATAGPNTRTTQLFINLANNPRLDAQGFSPFGKVVEGMDIVDALYTGYGEGAPSGEGPDQNMVESRGNEYLAANFPRLDYIKTARIVQ